ncbi:autotransporter assembly complex protein TamA [Govanella unica]|uniref:Autotransporter assembly complex protein TamA n=1 Tax=Govanella unica TaxID=2975056 RepID=A0A9X3TVD8_9PROT|nr:autotransporter assembly complex family protein [Govania unica]MDA5192413.1 autotransporter assembly complex protein TamA [Govania unica]
MTSARGRGRKAVFGSACLGVLLSFGVLPMPVFAQTIEDKQSLPPTDDDLLDDGGSDAGTDSAPTPAQKPKAKSPEAKPKTARGVPYSFAIDGLKDSEGTELFQEISLLRKNRGKPARAQAELRSWIQRDITSLTEILRSQGYYGSRISYLMDRRKSPLAVTLRVTEGPRYKITAFKVDLLGMPETAMAKSEAATIHQSFDRRLPKVGDPAQSARVVEAEQRILLRLPQIGYPRAAVKDQDIVVDHALQSMDVTLKVTPGPRTCFGEPEFSGAPNVEHRYLGRLAPWKFGDVYDSRVVDEFRLELSKTLLFSGISTAVGTPDRLGCAPILVNLSEDKPRSYGFGATYGSSDGFGVNAFWEHRNFAGAGEKFRVEGKAVEIEQSVTALYEVPGFQRRNQWLLFGGGFERQSTDAYKSYNIISSVAVKRKLAKVWTVQVGPSLEFSSINDGFTQRNYYLLGAQGVVAYDSTNDIFDPRRGQKLSLSLRPYVGEESGLLNFNIVELAGSSYWAFDRRNRYLLAGRFKLGSITGESLERIPANKRFYAGGGASVRGYAYQAAGPVDVLNMPMGGRSLMEGSVEFRARVTDNIGVVPFLDVGTVGNSVLPDFSDKLFWGAGIGLRYYTSFAPVRVDFAVPLNRRPSDSRYQIYISLGQSF